MYRKKFTMLDFTDLRVFVLLGFISMNLLSETWEICFAYMLEGSYRIPVTACPLPRLLLISFSSGLYITIYFQYCMYHEVDIYNHLVDFCVTYLHEI